MILKTIRLLIKFFLIVVGLIGFTKCRPKQKGLHREIVFHGLTSTDPNFVVLNNNFAKDSTQVFFKQYIIHQAHVSSFEVLNDYYAKDEKSVYYCEEYREGRDYFFTKNKTISTVENADPSSFKDLDYGYAKDNKQAYLDGRPFIVKDVESFKAIGAFISKDKFQVYYLTNPVIGIDGQSFELLSGFYAKDNYNYYYYIYPNIDGKTIHKICNIDSPLEILEHPYSKNKTFVYYGSQKLIGLNPNTLEVINSSFVKDDNIVMYGLKSIQSVDAASFIVPDQTNQLTNSEYFTYDKNLVFFGYDIITGAKPDSFIILGFDYSSDKNYVYYKTKRVASADNKTFKILEYGYGGKDAEDDKNEYFQGKIILVK